MAAMIRVSRRRPVAVDVDESDLFLDTDIAALLSGELEKVAVGAASTA